MSVTHPLTPACSREGSVTLLLLAAPERAMAQTTSVTPVCERTEQVRAAIVRKVPGVNACGGALDFAHFGNGSSGDGSLITSDLVLVNVGTTTIRPALYFYDPGGNRIAAESLVDVVGDLEVREDGGLTVRTAMEPLGELTISTHGRGEVVKGAVLEEVEIPLEAKGQDARFIDEVFTGTDTSDFVGSVRCTAPSEGRFTGVAVEMDAGNGIFTTLPVMPVQR